MIVGWLLGMAAAAALSIATTLLFGLESDVAFLVGCVYGFVCTTIGMAVAG